MSNDDGGFTLAGTTTSYGAGSDDFYLVKVDSTGREIWSKTYGGPESELAFTATRTLDGGYALAGITSSWQAGTQDVYIVKVDAEGNAEWSRTYGGSGVERAESIARTPDGGFAICGNTTSFGSGRWDIFVIRLDAQGDTLWTRTYGTAWDDNGEGICYTEDGGFALTGSLGAFGQANICIIKINDSGLQEWVQTYVLNHHEHGYDIDNTLDGGFVIAGGERANTIENFYVIRTDHRGIRLWAYTYGRSEVDRALAVRSCVDGGFIVAGQTVAGTNNYDMYVIKLDAFGTVQWQRTIGGDRSERADAVDQMVDGGYVVAGYTDSFGTGYGNMFAVRLDQNGH
jgi:hypothetical protein